MHIIVNAYWFLLHVTSNGLSSPLKWNPLESEELSNEVEHSFMFANLLYDTVDNVWKISLLIFEAFSNSIFSLKIDIV